MTHVAKVNVLNMSTSLSQNGLDLWDFSQFSRPKIWLGPAFTRIPHTPRFWGL